MIELFICCSQQIPIMSVYISEVLNIYFILHGDCVPLFRLMGVVSAATNSHPVELGEGDLTPEMLSSLANVMSAARLVE